MTKTRLRDLLPSASRTVARVRLRTSFFLIVIALAFAAAGAAVAGSKIQDGHAQNVASTSDTLTIPFISDVQTIDPNVYYAAEGLMVTRALYEGLLRDTPNRAGVPLKYLPTAKRYQPWLAKSWNVSRDGLTYTFHLRSGVKFHDGTSVTAKAWQLAFQRDRAVNQGPAYMVGDVKSTSAPSPLTFVVKLRKPCNPFLDYLASPYAPVVISPEVLKKYSADHAQKWLSRHDSGTGPYRITEYVPNDHYTLEAFSNYWGTKPHFKKVVIRIIPNLETQKSLLSTGEVDMITKGLSIQDIQQYEKNKSVSVTKFAVALNVGMFINPKGAFDKIPLRTALRHAINRRALVTPAYGNTATYATQFYPPGVFPENSGIDDPTYDPTMLRKLLPSMSSKKISIAYGVESGEPIRVLANLIQVQLQAVGLQPTVRVLQTAQLYSLYKAPQSQRPDILVQYVGLDALHPDTVARIVFMTGAEPLNFFGYSYPAVDKGIQNGLRATTDKAFISAYTLAAKELIRQAVVMSVVNSYDVIVARKGITGFVHDPAAPQAVSLGDLRSVG